MSKAHLKVIAIVLIVLVAVNEGGKRNIPVLRQLRKAALG